MALTPHGVDDIAKIKAVCTLKPERVIVAGGDGTIKSAESLKM
jgi:diacylglycerol kinase family enzyme